MDLGFVSTLAENQHSKSECTALFRIWKSLLMRCLLGGALSISSWFQQNMH